MRGSWSWKCKGQKDHLTISLISTKKMIQDLKIFNSAQKLWSESMRVQLETRHSNRNTNSEINLKLEIKAEEEYNLIHSSTFYNIEISPEI